MSSEEQHKDLELEHWTGLKICALCMFIVELIVSLYLMYRQGVHMKSVQDVPPILKRFDDGLYLNDDLDYSRQYSGEKLVHDAVEKFYITLLWIFAIGFDWISYTWKISNELSSIWPRFFSPVIASNMTFAMICFAASDFFMVPMYAQHILRMIKYGKWRVTDFFFKFFKSLVMNTFSVGIFAGLITWLLETLDSARPLTQSIVLGLLITLFVLIYPSVEIWVLIAERKSILKSRRANDTSKSPSSLAVERRLHSLCNRVGFPRSNLNLFPSGTTQTTAFYYGFLWYHQIIVFQGHEEVKAREEADGTEEDPASLTLTPKEIEAIVAHELGHWYYSHSDQTVLLWHIITISALLLVYWLRSHQTIVDLASNGAHLEKGVNYIPGVFVAYYIVLRVYTTMFDVLLQVHSQLTEKQADEYAAIQLGYYKDFTKGLIKIILAQEITFPSADPLYQICYHNHPSLVQRLQLIYHQYKLIKQS